MLQTDFLRPDAMPIRLEETVFLPMCHNQSYYPECGSFEGEGAIPTSNAWGYKSSCLIVSNLLQTRGGSTSGIKRELHLLQSTLKYERIIVTARNREMEINTMNRKPKRIYFLSQCAII